MVTSSYFLIVTSSVICMYVYACPLCLINLSHCIVFFFFTQWGEAKYHRYRYFTSDDQDMRKGVPNSLHVVHVVPPEIKSFVVTKSNEDDLRKQLAYAYSNVLIQVCLSHDRILFIFTLTSSSSDCYLFLGMIGCREREECFKIISIANGFASSRSRWS